MTNQTSVVTPKITTQKEIDKRICGYCYTATHEKCRPVIRWYDKEWYCNCNCQKTKEGK